VGVANQNIPSRWLPLTSPNLGAAIMKSGGSRLPASVNPCRIPVGTAAQTALWCLANKLGRLTDLYRRKHNPAINWTDQNAPTSARGLKGDLANHVLPVSVNLGFDPTQDPVLKKAFRGFVKDENGKPLGFDRLPTVSLVIPNEQNDAHSNSAEMADGWLQRNLGAYAQWAMTHNSLLIVTFDEDGSTDSRQGDPYQTGTHRIATIFVGAGVKPGVYDAPIDHLNVLSTVLWLHGALDTFRVDFRQFHQVREGSGSEAELEALNLQPITQVFGKSKP
jgi:hypothetical protein